MSFLLEVDLCFALSKFQLALVDLCVKIKQALQHLLVVLCRISHRRPNTSEAGRSQLDWMLQHDCHAAPANWLAPASSNTLRVSLAACRKVSRSVRLRLKLLPSLPPVVSMATIGAASFDYPSAKTGTVAALAPVSGCAISCNHAGTEASPPLAPAPGCAISCSHCRIGCVSAARDCEYIRRNGTLHSSVALLDQRLPWDLFSHFRNSMGGLNHVLPGSQSSNNCRVVQT